MGSDLAQQMEEGQTPILPAYLGKVSTFVVGLIACSPRAIFEGRVKGHLIFICCCNLQKWSSAPLKQRLDALFGAISTESGNITCHRGCIDLTGLLVVIWLVSRLELTFLQVLHLHPPQLSSTVWCWPMASNTSLLYLCWLSRPFDWRWPHRLIQWIENIHCSSGSIGTRHPARLSNTKVPVGSGVLKSKFWSSLGS